VPPGTPEPPTITHIFKNECKLHWQPPFSDGGAKITGYHIERRSTTSARWIHINREPIRDTHLHVTDLMENTEYDFRVTAENKAGQGDASSPSLRIRAKDPWGKSVMG
jgi:titin